MADPIRNLRAGHAAAAGTKCPFPLPSSEGIGWLAGKWCAETGRDMPARAKLAGRAITLTWADGKEIKLAWDNLRKRVAPAG